MPESGNCYRDTDRLGHMEPPECFEYRLLQNKENSLIKHPKKIHTLLLVLEVDYYGGGDDRERVVPGVAASFPYFIE